MCLFCNSIYICVLFCTISMLIFSITIIIKRFFNKYNINCHQDFQHPRVTKQSDIKGSAFLFMIAQGLFFLPDTCWPLQLWLWQTHSNYMTSMWFMCLIPPGLLAGATQKQSVSLWQIQLRAFQTSNVISSRMPFCLGPAITAFCNLCKHDSDTTFNNILKTNDINNNIQNYDSKMMIIQQK